MMQPYPNPNYFSQYQQPMQNPYMDRMAQLQQYQQNLQQPMPQTSMPGKSPGNVKMISFSDLLILVAFPWNLLLIKIFFICLYLRLIYLLIL